MATLEDEITRLMQKCLSCGKCTPLCPSARHGGCDPHEIMMIGEGDLDQCINCGNCSRVCRRTDPMAVIKGLYYLQHEGEFSDIFSRTGYSIPMEDHPSRNELDPAWDGDDVQIFPGCTIKCKVPFLEYASSVAVKSVGKRCKELDNNGCCLRPAQFSPKNGLERRSYLTGMVASAGSNEVITLCPGCSGEFTKISLDVKNIIQFLYSHISELPKIERPFKVALEPGCEAMDLKNEMKDVVSAMGFEVLNNRMGCCGKNTAVSEELMKEREAECSGCGAIVVACPTCFIKYDSWKNGKPVLYLSELVALAAGDDSTLKYHHNKVDLNDELLYNPTDKVCTASFESKTRW